MTAPPDVMKPIRDGLEDADRAVRAASIEGLAILRDRDGLLMGLNNHDEYVRQRAAASLAMQPGWRVSCRLLCAVRDRDRDVRAAVAGSFGQRSGLLSLFGLRALARDWEASVRYAALRGLVQRRWPGTARLLREAAESDPDRWVRDEARILLRDVERHRKQGR